METKKSFRLLLIVIMIALAGVSHFVISPYISNPENHYDSIQYIDQKETAVKEASAAALGASVAVTLMPDDIGSSISDKLADITSYLLVVLCALIFEKYFISIIGLATFGYIIPIALLLAAVNIFLRIPFVKNAIVKVCILSLALNMVIPVSIQVSQNLEATYASTMDLKYINSLLDGTAENETETEADADKSAVAKTDAGKTAETQAAQTKSSEEKADSANAAQEETEAEESKGLFSSLSSMVDSIQEAAGSVTTAVGETVGNVTDTVTDTVTNAANVLTEEIQKKIAQLEEAIDRFTEYCAVMIVTTALIPVMVFMFFVWIINTVLQTYVPGDQFKINFAGFGGPGGKSHIPGIGRKKREEIGEEEE